MSRAVQWFWRAWRGARVGASFAPPFPHPHTIDAALANAFMGDESTEAFQLRLDAAQEENAYMRRHNV